MFDRLLDQVTFDDVQAFCKQFPEGVRVEYKSQLVQTDKIVASLANTVGGFFGVRTDDKNMPILPIDGMPARKVLPKTGEYPWRVYVSDGHRSGSARCSRRSSQ